MTTAPRPRVRKPPPAWLQYVVAVLNGAVLAVIMIAGAGGARPYLAPPARAWGVALVIVYQVASISLSGVFVRDAVRARESRWFWPLLQLLGTFMLVGLPICDVRGFAVLRDAPGLRSAGLLVTGLAFVFRLGPMIQLGRRFTPAVTRLPGHRIEMAGFYAHVRHPSYVGMMLLFLGLTLTFRSALGLALLVPMGALLVWRIRTEERFLLEQFGDEYRAYVRRTARLLPGVY